MIEFLQSAFSHLWQSTLFAALVALLTLALRKNHARWRYRLWLAASLKFLIPFALLVGLGSQFGRMLPHLARQPRLTVLMSGSGETFITPLTNPILNPKPHVGFAILPVLLLALWFGGCVAVLVRSTMRWLSLHAIVRRAAPMPEGRELRALRRIQHARTVAMRLSPAAIEPGIFGVFRPVLLWPEGISAHLADAQLEAIIVHELCHIRRRDNLAAALHMLVEAVFWFHPLVWWLGARMIAERENACDEEVLRLGNPPEVYAESILKTCRYYLESPIACMAGVTGADLKQRIERIMTQHFACKLDRGRQLLLAAAGVAAILAPVMVGMWHAPVARAQSAPEAKPKFEVASIKPNTSGDRNVGFRIMPGGKISCNNATPKVLVMMAYDLKPHQIEGGPSWFDTVHYDINAEASGPTDRSQLKLMLQSLLADRFKLVTHRETKEMPIYALVVAKNGPKLQKSESQGEMRARFRIGRGELTLESADMAGLADALSNQVGRTVLDRTGITGHYDIKVQWTPDESEGRMLKGPPGASPGPGPDAPPPDAGPSVFTAIQEQLGLKLEPQKGPVEVLVIDHIEKASEN